MKSFLSSLFSSCKLSACTKRGPELPLLMDVRVINHSFRCGYRIKDDEQYVISIEPVEDELRKQYGIFDIYSKNIYRDFSDGSVITLPFVRNPTYKKENLNDSPLLLFIDQF